MLEEIHSASAARSDRRQVCCTQSSLVWRRSPFEADRFAFAASRRNWEPGVGRLGRRVFGMASARAINSSSRALGFGSIGFLRAVPAGGDDHAVLRGATAG